MSFISYAQNCEDVMLWRALKDIRRGFYIDVGANDPETDSVTKAFYDRGWSGINIEPIESHYAALKAARERDINLQCAAGAAAGELEIWNSETRGWSTMDAEVVAIHERKGHAGSWQKVPVRTLTDICTEHAGGDIHFLKIDVEGFEGDVLKGMDFDAYRPWVVVVEATVPDSQVENFSDWEGGLLNKAYECVYADGLNRFYLAREHGGLSGAFKYPPNVFDDFVCSGHYAALIQVGEADARVARAEALTTQAEARLAQAENLVSQAEIRAEQVDILSKRLDVRAARAETRATQAEALAAQSERRASQAEERAFAAESRVRDLLGSTSWRVTAPLRWPIEATRRLRRGGMRAGAKVLLRHAAGHIGRHPRLKRLVLGALNRFPAFKSRLVGAMTATAGSGQRRQLEGAPTELAALSFRARQVYFDLTVEIERHKKRGN